MPPLPFQIDRSSRLSLTRQLVDGFRRAIAEGRYAEGGLLPSLAEITAATGVCPVVVRSAIRRLAAEGIVNPRPGYGTVVLDAKTARWRGHVAIITAEISDNYTHAQLAGRIAGALVKSGYLVTKVPVPPDNEKRNTAPPLEALLSEGITHAIVFGAWSPSVDQALKKARIPRITLSYGYSPVKPAGTVLRLDPLSALPDLVAHCRASGVKSVVYVVYEHDTPDVRRAFEEAGIACRLAPVVRPQDALEVDSATELAMRGMYRWLEGGAAPLPDLLFFTDNILAEGALLALMRHGVRIPEDVGFATWMPKGDRPVYWKEITRLETDPMKDGDKIGRIILRILAGGAAPSSPVLTSVFKAGETFPATGN